MRILVVDDDLILGKNLVNILTDKGYAVELAVNGNAAVSKIKSDIFDLVLLDIKLPDINGIEVFKRIKENNTKADVIFMSAFPFDKTTMEILQDDKVRYFNKPFDINTVLSAVEQIRN